ncbi:MAG: hypothetical protein ACOYNH_01940 [Bacteroidia bacterium]|jgi:hypothetical protein
MPIYRFRAILEDHEDVYRDIDIKPEQTFEQFAIVLKNAFGLKENLFCAFYNSDDYYRKGSEIEFFILDKKGKAFPTEICDEVAAPHQKFLIVVDDVLSTYILHLELFKILKEADKKLTYPTCVKTIGNMPKPTIRSIVAPPVDEEDLKSSELFFKELESGEDEQAYEEEVLVPDLSDDDTSEDSEKASFSIDTDDENENGNEDEVSEGGDEMMDNEEDF